MVPMRQEILASHSVMLRVRDHGSHRKNNVLVAKVLNLHGTPYACRYGTSSDHRFIINLQCNLQNPKHTHHDPSRT